MTKPPSSSQTFNWLCRCLALSLRRAHSRATLKLVKRDRREAAWARDTVVYRVIECLIHGRRVIAWLGYPEQYGSGQFDVGTASHIATVRPRRCGAVDERSLTAC